jgi:hypothetical protein
MCVFFYHHALHYHTFSGSLTPLNNSKHNFKHNFKHKHNSILSIAPSRFLFAIGFSSVVGHRSAKGGRDLDGPDMSRPFDIQMSKSNKLNGNGRHNSAGWTRGVGTPRRWEVDQRIVCTAGAGRPGHREQGFLGF